MNNDQKDARSVHLAYTVPPAVTAFYTTVTVEESHAGSFFMAIGTSKPGLYCGLQQATNGHNKQAIFSMWNAKDNGVNLIEKGEGVNVTPFGNEGTGLKAELPYDWQAGCAYRFAVFAKTENVFEAKFLDPVSKEWKLLAVYERNESGRHLHGLYSFVEDFKRDGHSATVRRAAMFSDTEATLEDHPSNRFAVLVARFTAWSPHPSNNINAESMEDGFRLETGGDVRQHWPIDQELPSRLTSAAPSDPLADGDSVHVFTTRRDAQDKFGRGRLVHNRIVDGKVVDSRVISDKVVTSAAKAVVWKGATHILWRDENGALWDTSGSGDQWTDTQIYADARILGAPIPLPVSTHPKVFWRNSDGHLWMSEFATMSQRWQQGRISANYLATSPTAIPTLPNGEPFAMGYMAAFWKGIDGRLWMSTYDNAARWKDAVVFDGSVTTSRPAAYFRQETQSTAVFSWALNREFVMSVNPHGKPYWNRVRVRGLGECPRSYPQPKLLVLWEEDVRFVLLQLSHSSNRDIKVHFLESEGGDLPSWKAVEGTVARDTEFGGSAPSGRLIDPLRLQICWRFLEGDGALESKNLFEFGESKETESVVTQGAPDSEPRQP